MPLPCQFKFAPICLVLVLSLFWAPVGLAQDSPATDTPTTGSTSSLAQRLSPQETVRTFFDAMVAVDLGNTERLEEAINCLYLGEELVGDVRITQGTELANRLFKILNALEFKMDSVPDVVEEGVSNLDVVLGSGDQSITLTLRRYDDGLWRFHSSTVSEEKLDALQEQVDEAKPEQEGETTAQHVEQLKSPRAAVSWFLNCMNEREGLTRVQALEAMDLSSVTTAMHASWGGQQASILKFILDRWKLIELSELPGDNYTETSYILFQEPKGRIVLQRNEIEEGLWGWQFSQASLDEKNLEKLQDAFMDRVVVEGLSNSEDTLPIASRIRLFVRRLEIPLLMNKPLYLENWQWLGLFLVILFGMIVSRIVTFFLSRGLRRWFNEAKIHLDSKLEKEFARPIRIALMAWFWLLGLHVLQLPLNALEILRIAAIGVTTVGAIWALYKLIDIGGAYMAKRASKTDNKFDDLFVPIVIRSLKITLIILGLVTISQQQDRWDLSAILTGLGLGGLAFALAAKDVVANFFGSMTIIVDRPFELGDWVTIGDVDGNVESVGIRSTRIRTFYNSLITVPNADVVNSAIDNWGKRKYRRIKTNLSITYDTPPEKIEAFCEAIRELIRQHPYTRKDYFHVYLNQFSASSLDVLLYCFLETPEWNTELRERHRLFLDILRVAKELGVEFAFPTQTLFMREDQSPEHGATQQPDAAKKAGVMAANKITREFTGPPGTIPPPVHFKHKPYYELEGEAPGENSGENGE